MFKLLLSKDGEMSQQEQSPNRSLFMTNDYNRQPLGGSPIEEFPNGFGMHRVSIIILSCHDGHDLSKCLSAVNENTQDYPNHEIILYRDACSTPLGYARAATAAAKGAAGDYIAILGNDSLPQSRWLSEAMILMLDSFPEGKGLVGFNNSRGWESFYHFLINRLIVDILPHGQLFQEDYTDILCNRELLERLAAKGLYRSSKRAIVLAHPRGDAARMFGVGQYNDNLDDQLSKTRGLDTVIFYKRKPMWDPNRKLWELKNSQAGRAATIIIVTFQSEKTILPCLHSVSKWLRPIDEIMVVDNDSSDGTQEILKKLFLETPNLRILLNKRNCGFSAACNQAAREARNSFLIFLNPDTVVTDGWVEKLLSKLGTQVKAAGPISNYAAGFQNATLYNHYPIAGNIDIDVAGRMYEDWWFGKNISVKLLTGFCLATERGTFESLGFFDERFFVGNEDLDYCWQLTLRGYEMVVAPDVFVYHFGHSSFSPKAEVLTSESTHALFKKLEDHYGRGEVPTPNNIWGIDLIGPGRFPFKSKDNA